MNPYPASPKCDNFTSGKSQNFTGRIWGRWPKAGGGWIGKNAAKLPEALASVKAWVEGKTN